MPELSEEIRSFIESGAPPLTAAELAPRLAPRRVPKRRPRGSLRARPWLAAGLAVVVSIVVVAIALGLRVTLSGIHTNSIRASATLVLNDAADVAQSQAPLTPAPGQYLYVRTLDGTLRAAANGKSNPLARYYVESVTQIWSAPGAAGNNTIETVGAPRFVTAADRTQWEADGSPVIEPGFSGGGRATYYDVADLPTDPSKMAAYFASQSYLEVDRPWGRDADWEFTTAAEFLQNGASSVQRAALLRFMATLPGVTNLGTGTTLGTTQSGTVLSIPSNTAGMATEAVLDPATSEVLEERLVVTDPAQAFLASPSKVAAGLAWVPLAKGQAFAYVDFLYSGLTGSLQSAPPSAPALPVPWPYGTAVAPLPDPAYP